MDCCHTDHKHNKTEKKIEKIEMKELNKEHNKEKYVSYVSSFTGFGGIFSSYQVCHSVCLGVIALLSLIGISLAGMPFLFLQKIALPLWIIALFLFSISIILHIKYGECIPKNLLIFNSGAIIVGIPFFIQLRTYFLIIGFSIIAFSLYLIIKKWRRK